MIPDEMARIVRGAGGSVPRFGLSGELRAITFW